MQIPSLFPAYAGRRLLAAAVLVVALAFLLAAHTYAAEGPQYGTIGQYGEITRFGGFDSTWFDEGKYDGQGASPAETEPAPGKFLNPVGFAVDTHDEGTSNTALYVLDRVSGDAAQAGPSGTEWRLQKLSDTGAVLGTTEFYLPPDRISEAEYSVFVGVVGLAVDDTTGRIYTVLYGSTGQEEETTRYAEEVLAWSTTPTPEGKLVAPTTASGDYPALNLDKISTPVSGYTPAGVLSTTAQLNSTPLYEPQGLALDVTGGQDNVALEAEGAKRTSGGEIQGPAIVERISTETGAEAANWSATTGLAGVANSYADNAKAMAAGISTNPDGSLNVLLSGTNDTNSPKVDVLDLPANLTAPPTVLSSSSLDPSNSQANPVAGSNQDLNVKGIGPYGSGNGAPQGVELSNGLYAADYSESTGGHGYWEGNEVEGIRLVTPNTESLLSSTLAPATSIFDTLGNANPDGSCAIDASAPNDVSLAEGANGTIWVLTAGSDSASYKGQDLASYTSGRQIIEFSPGATDACIAPSGTFSLGEEGGSPHPASENGHLTPLTIAVDSTVDFSASTIDYPTNAGEPSAIYAYEWDPTGAGFTTIDDTLSAGAFQPPATASYQYTVPGVYPVKLKLLGDFGEYDEEGSVIVQTASPPTAAFTAPSGAQTSQSVSFDASSSRPASGAQIVDYHWNFGDGSSDETQNASDTHVYSSPGTYTIALVVRDNDGRESTQATQQITITSPPAGGGQTTTGGGNNTTTITTPISPPAAILDRNATNVSPKATEVNGAVQVVLSCPATKVSCAGTIQIKTANAVATSAKAKKRVLMLGQAYFSLTGDVKKSLTIKISSNGLVLLKKDKTLKIDVVVAAHDSYGDPLTQTLTLTLHQLAKKSKRK